MGAFRPGAGQPPRRKECTPEAEEVRKIANRDKQGLVLPESSQRRNFSVSRDILGLPSISASVKCLTKSLEDAKLDFQLLTDFIYRCFGLSARHLLDKFLLRVYD